MILVVGATGLLGGEIVRQLLAQGKNVRAFVRSVSKKSDELAASGASLAFGDLSDRESVRQACVGVDAIVTTASAMSSQSPSDSFESVDRDGQLALVSEGEKASVNRFVFISSPESADTSPLQASKLAVEAKLLTGSLPFVILRPSFLMEVWLSPALGFDYVERRARLYGDGKRPISWVSVVDVARAIVWAIDAPSAVRQTIELGGAASLSPLEVLALFEHESGRRFAYEMLPESVLREQYAAALDPRQRTFFAVALQYARGHALDLLALPSEMPRPECDVASYARRILQRSN